MAELTHFAFKAISERGLLLPVNIVLNIALTSLATVPPDEAVRLPLPDEPP